MSNKKNRTTAERKAKRVERAEKIEKAIQNAPVEPSVEKEEGIQNFTRAQLASLLLVAIGFTKIMDCSKALSEGTENPTTCYSYLGEENEATCTHPEFSSMIQVKYHSGLYVAGLVTCFILSLWHSEPIFLKFTTLLSFAPLGLSAVTALASAQHLSRSRLWHYLIVSTVLFNVAYPRSQMPTKMENPFELKNLQGLALGSLICFSLFEVVQVMITSGASPENSLVQTLSPLPAAARALVNFWVVDKLSVTAMYAFAAVYFENRIQRSLLLTVGIFKLAEYFLLHRNMEADFHGSDFVEGTTLGTAVLSLVAWIA